MCNNPFKKMRFYHPQPHPQPRPQPEPEAPAPQAVQTQDVDATGNEGARQRRRRGYAATRVADDRAVLTDNATGKRTTLG